jgi:hypothetical protein
VYTPASPHEEASAVFLSERKQGGAWWLMPIIVTTWEAEIRRIEVLGWLEQIVYEK